MTDKITMIQALNAALNDAMEADDKVLVIGEDVADNEGGGVAGVTKGLSTKYGVNRVRSAPISEQAIIGAAIGASLVGYRPVAEIMLMNFTTVAMDMITNHAAKLRYMSGGQTHVPLVIRTMTGSGMSNAGQHSDYLEAWFAHTPGLKVVAPSNPRDAYGLLRSAIEDDDPVICVENLPLYFSPDEAPEKGFRVPLGKAAVRREGRDITIVTYSRMVVEALEAAKILADDGVDVEVLDLRTIQPWDRDAVMTSVAKTGRCLVVHEAVKQFGIGGEIASEVNEELFGQLKAPVKRLGAPYAPVPFSKALEEHYAPSRRSIADTVKSMFA